MEPLLTTQDVADYMQVSRWSVARLVRIGELRCITIGKRKRRFRQSDVEKYINKRTRKSRYGNQDKETDREEADEASQG